MYGDSDDDDILGMRVHIALPYIIWTDLRCPPKPPKASATTQASGQPANHVDPTGPERGPASPGYEPGLSVRRRRGRRSRVSFTGQAAAQKEEAIRRTRPQFVIGLGRLGTKGGKRRRHWLAWATRWQRREDGPREAQGQTHVSLGRCEYRRIFSQR